MWATRRRPTHYDFSHAKARLKYQLEAAEKKSRTWHFLMTIQKYANSSIFKCLQRNADFFHRSRSGSVGIRRNIRNI